MERVANWKLAHRTQYVKNAIFKTKLIHEDKLLVHVPADRTVRTLDLSLHDLGITYTFHGRFNAMEYFELNGSHLVMVGLNTGVIEVQSAEAHLSICLLDQKVEPQNFNGCYINDILHLGGGRLVNCYNNGSLAFWDLNRSQE